MPAFFLGAPKTIRRAAAFGGTANNGLQIARLLLRYPPLPAGSNRANTIPATFTPPAIHTADA